MLMRDMGAPLVRKMHARIAKLAAVTSPVKCRSAIDAIAGLYGSRNGSRSPHSRRASTREPIGIFVGEKTRRTSRR
jgi:hypothetical protein